MFDVGARSKPLGKRKGGYDRHRDQAAQRQAKQSRSGREIGPPPEVGNPKRKGRCRDDFKAFCKAYGPGVFTLPWANPHEAAAARIERVVQSGGLFALAMPRGWGKTTLCLWATLWATLYGSRRFVVYVGATGDEAAKRIEELKVELETNDLLAEDFPEICWPIRALEGITQRGRGQTVNGQRTYIGWRGRRIVLPTVAGSPASGTVIEARGITGAIRGMRHTTPDGRSVRPDMAIPDDPQDDKSAASPSQVAKRLRVLNGSVLRLPGPKQRIAAFVPCTVIQPDDLADQLLDRKRNPQWQGQRTQALDAMPTNDKAWSAYAEVRADGLRAEDGGKAANAHYRKHRKALERGAKVVWPQNIEAGDVSALQSLMNQKIDGEDTFLAEQQQAPRVAGGDADEKLTADIIEAKMHAPALEVVPQNAQRLAAFIDPSSKLIWWMVCAFGDQFTGHAIAWGAWPDQGLPYYAKAAARKTLATQLKGKGREAQVLNGLEQVAEHLLDREWATEGGSSMRIDRCLVDANWGPVTSLVYQFCRQSDHAAILTPSHGKGIGPTETPMDQWTRTQDGDRAGQAWRERMSTAHAKRFVLFDSNHWKTFVADRLRTARGDAGSLTLAPVKGQARRMLTDHLLAETPHLVSGRGRELTVWKEPPGRDNDWFDGLVGCHVAASMSGITATGQIQAPKPARPRSRKRLSVTF